MALKTGDRVRILTGIFRGEEGTVIGYGKDRFYHVQPDGVEGFKLYFKHELELSVIPE